MSNKDKTEVIFSFIDLAGSVYNDNQDHFKKLISLNMAGRPWLLIVLWWFGILMAFASFGLGWYCGEIPGQVIGFVIVGWNLWDEYKRGLTRRNQNAYLDSIYELVISSTDITPDAVRVRYVRLMGFVLSQPPAYL